MCTWNIHLHPNILETKMNLTTPIPDSSISIGKDSISDYNRVLHWSQIHNLWCPCMKRDIRVPLTISEEPLTQSFKKYPTCLFSLLSPISHWTLGAHEKIYSHLLFYLFFSFCVKLRSTVFMTFINQSMQFNFELAKRIRKLSSKDTMKKEKEWYIECTG